jgi:hypothetical protein
MDGVKSADVEGATREARVWLGWRRVGVERRVEEKGREERRVEGVVVVWGVNWEILDWEEGC